MSTPDYTASEWDEHGRCTYPHRCYGWEAVGHELDCPHVAGEAASRAPDYRPLRR